MVWGFFLSLVMWWAVGVATGHTFGGWIHVVPVVFVVFVFVEYRRSSR